MKLEECTKAELMFIIKHMAKSDYISDFKLQTALSELEFKRTEKIIKEADNWNVIAAECRKRYAELLKPYGNFRFVDIPIPILQEADRCLKDARRADREWGLCMKRLGDSND